MEAEPPPLPPNETNELAPGSLSLLEQRFHKIMLVGAMAVIVMAFLLEVQPDGRVHFRFAPNHALPHTCGSRVLFNMDCAGCGLTRSFIHLAAFRFRQSWDIHRAGWIMAFLVIAQIPYRTIRLRNPAMRTPAWTPWLAGLVIVCIFLHWILLQFGI